MVSRTAGLLVLAMLAAANQILGQASSPAASASQSVEDELQRPYDELMQRAPTLHFTTDELFAARKRVGQEQDRCISRSKSAANRYDKQLRDAEGQLSTSRAPMSEAKREELHCRIQNLRILKAQAELVCTQMAPIAFENKRAKLDLIEKWPRDLQQLNQQIAAGTHLSRRWGNVDDIGFRQIQKNQQDDIKRGEEAIRDMRQRSILPKELANTAVTDYVNTVAQKLAVRSDLQVPLHVTVLDSSEVNAFALPGGFLFVERGLLEEVDDESELAGVMAHEMAHISARHGYRLMKKATISSLIFQAAQVAALIFSGGISGIGSYYAMQYGFYGLGFVLDLQLLGVSRDFELEADNLGVQYAWNAEYHVEGFVRFFDKLANKHGYAMGASWFRTHPPFYQRIVQSKREMMFLPVKEQMIVQTTQFEEMKLALAPDVARARKKEAIKGPTLYRTKEPCVAPPPLYKPEDPIESICARFEIGPK